MPFEADLATFYGPPFGAPCARRRPGVDDVAFRGIPGAVDNLGLDGYAVSTDYGLRYPTADVDIDAGDHVIVGCDADKAGAVALVFGAAQGGTEYVVRAEPRIINDGAETEARLSSIPV